VCVRAGDTVTVRRSLKRYRLPPTRRRRRITLQMIRYGPPPPR